MTSDPDSTPAAPSSPDELPAATPSQNRSKGRPEEKTERKPKPATLEALIEFAYAEAGRKLQLARRDVEALRVSAEGSPAEMETLRRLAKGDPLLQVPPRLLSLIADFGTRTDLRNRIAELVLAALADHPAFKTHLARLSDAKLQPPLRGSHVSEAVGGMPSHELEMTTEEFKPHDRERLRVNAVTAFALLRVLRDRWPLDQFVDEMTENVWRTSGRNPRGDGPRAAILASSRDVDALGLLSRHFESALHHAEHRTRELRAGLIQAERRADREQADKEKTVVQLEVVEQRANELEVRLAEVEAELERERSHRVVDRTHAVDDYQVLRARVIRQLGAQVDLLSDGLHAIRNDRMAVAEEFVDRALTAIQTEVGKLKELRGGTR